MNTKITLSIITLLLSSCTSNNGSIEIDSSLFAVETATLTKDGLWEYSDGVRHYEGDKNCLSNKFRIEQEIRMGAEIGAPKTPPKWLFYVGTPRKGTAYGYYMTDDIKAPISYSNNEWHTIEHGSLGKLEKIFRDVCLKEETVEAPTRWQLLLQKYGFM